MILTVVEFSLAEPIERSRAVDRFRLGALSYLTVEGLVSKYYVWASDGHRVGAIYVWETRRDAERFFDESWRERMRAKYGAPMITWFECPVVVDNVAGQVRMNG